MVTVPSQISNQANAILLAATNRMIQLSAQAGNNAVNGIESKNQFKVAKNITKLLLAYQYANNMTQELSDSILYALQQLSGQLLFTTISPIVGQSLNVSLIISGGNIYFYNQGILLGVATQMDFESVVASIAGARVTVTPPVGAVLYQGDWNASGNSFPVSGTGPGGIVRAGNMWNISVAGSPGGEPLNVGATIMAKVDSPGQTLSNWKIWY